MSKVISADQAILGTPARAGTPKSRSRTPSAPSSPSKRASSPTRPRQAPNVADDDDDMAALERAASLIRASLPPPENDTAFRPDSADPASGLMDETVRRTLLQRRAPKPVARPAIKQVPTQVAAHVLDVSDAKSVHAAMDEVVSPQTGNAWLAASAAMQARVGEVGTMQQVTQQTQPASRKASLKIDTDHVPQYPPATHHPAPALQIQQQQRAVHAMQRGYDADNDDDTDEDDHLVDQGGDDDDDDDEDDDIPLQAMRATGAAAAAIARPPSIQARAPSPVVESPDSPLTRTSAGGGSSSTTKAPPPILKGSLLSPSKYSHAVRGTQPALQLPLGPPSPMTPEIEEEELEATPAEDNIPLSLVHRTIPPAPGMDMNAMSMMMAGMRMGMMMGMGMGMRNAGMPNAAMGMGIPNPAMMMQQQQMYPGAGYNPYGTGHHLPYGAHLYAAGPGMMGAPPPMSAASAASAPLPGAFGYAPPPPGMMYHGGVPMSSMSDGHVYPQQGMPPAAGFMQMPLQQYPQPQQFMAPPMLQPVATEGKKASKKDKDKDKDKKKDKKEHRSSSRSRSRSRSPTRTDAPSDLESVPSSPVKDKDKKRSHHHHKDKDGKDNEKSKSKDKLAAAAPEPPRGRSPTPAPGHAANEAALATELRVNTTKPKVGTAVRSPDYVSATSTNSSAHTPVRQRLVTSSLVKDRISTMESRKEKKD
ncbi:hypothetical protein AMAG_12486 [Allomyces macrogynus ATCC 38327]|uniref:Uncharacterized protein n=1 Tax=Allomyces macrogynus (strain ATCC 38327) TaxID=578462 RepID=A0A0L0SZ41_ALLM3|nr:hypothetical protein AMAG_12486 [Allomyces macrogynus ATCC 38327]|eukprot:KNE67762.1 hypothetical protein AMAG_12486 [Allomyces macrogynus ATCC 38327]